MYVEETKYVLQHCTKDWYPKIVYMNCLIQYVILQVALI